MRLTDGKASHLLVCYRGQLLGDQQGMGIGNRKTWLVGKAKSCGCWVSPSSPWLKTEWLCDIKAGREVPDVHYSVKHTDWP